MALRKLFSGADLQIEDLCLLESFQIEYLDGWVPEREFASVLWAHPPIDRFLRERRPEVSSFLEATKGRFGPAVDEGELANAEETVVWTIADLLVYNKCPDLYDRLPFHGWDFAEVTSITPLTDTVVVDVGSGTGRVALEAATMADAVFAVEPVGRLREFIRDKAACRGLDNVCVVEGFCHSIPLPDSFAHVVITSHALRMASGGRVARVRARSGARRVRHPLPWHGRESAQQERGRAARTPHIARMGLRVRPVPGGRRLET